MASFFEKNKKKSSLALLLLFLKWRKGLAPLLLIVMLLMLMSFAPGNLMGICLAGLSKLPGGAHVAAAVTWTASKAGLEIGGVPHQNSYRDYVGAFRLAGDQGFAGLLQKRSFKDLIDAFKAARYDRNAAMALLFHNGQPGAPGARGAGAASGLNFITGGAESGSAGAIADKISRAGGKSVSGVMNPDDAKEGQAGVSLDEADLEGERAGMVRSALGAGLNPDSYLGGSGAFASKAFFAGGPGAAVAAGAMGPAAQKGANGSKIGKFAYGNGSKGGGARLVQTSRRGGGSMNLGRRGMKYSKALGTVRGMATANGDIRNATTLEEAAGGATEQWEGSPLTGSQASIPPTPPTIDAGGSGGGSFGGIPGGGSYGGYTGPTGANVPTVVGADPGIICSSSQLSQGMMSNGNDCVVDPSKTGYGGTDTKDYSDEQNDALKDILKGVAIGAAGAGMIAAGAWMIASGCGAAAGVALQVAGWAVALSGFAELLAAMKIGGHELSNGGHDGGGMMGMITITTALAAMGSVIAFCLTAMGGDAASAAVGLGTWSGIILGLGMLFLGMDALFGGTKPQTPQYDNPVDDAREQDAKLNANVGGGDTGLPAAPTGMHYETMSDGTQKLEYDYNTFPPGQNPPPSVEQDLNNQKGGGDSGLPPAPAGQHYEGVDDKGNPKLVPDYQIGVAARQDANSFTGGPPSKLDPAASGEHYELINNAGDPTDPKNWKLVNNYDIPTSDLKAANADKGQTGSVSMSCGPAQDGYHYEGYNCQQVKDYPIPASSGSGN